MADINSAGLSTAGMRSSSDDTNRVEISRGLNSRLVVGFSVELQGVGEMLTFCCSGGTRVGVLVRIAGEVRSSNDLKVRSLILTLPCFCLVGGWAVGSAWAVQCMSISSSDSSWLCVSIASLLESSWGVAS